MRLFGTTKKKIAWFSGLLGVAVVVVVGWIVISKMNTPSKPISQKENVTGKPANIKEDGTRRSVSQAVKTRDKTREINRGIPPNPETSSPIKDKSKEDSQVAENVKVNVGHVNNVHTGIAPKVKPASSSIPNPELSAVISPKNQKSKGKTEEPTKSTLPPPILPPSPKEAGGNETSNKDNNATLKTAMDACLAKYDAMQMPSIDELKALDDALATCNAPKPGESSRERAFFEHYSASLKLALLATPQDQVLMESIFNRMLLSCPTICKSEFGDDVVKVRDLTDDRQFTYYVKTFASEFEQIDHKDVGRFMGLLEEGKFKLFKFSKEDLECLKFMINFKVDRQSRLLFFQDLLSLGTTCPTMVAYSKYLSELTPYLDKSFNTQEEVDKAYARLETLYNDAISARSLNLSIPPKVNVNAIPLNCTFADEKFNQYFAAYLKSSSSEFIHDQTISTFDSAAEVCKDFQTGGTRIEYNGQQVSFATFYSRTFKEFEELLVKDMADKLRKLPVADRTEDKYLTPFGSIYALKDKIVPLI